MSSKSHYNRIVEVSKYTMLEYVFSFKDSKVVDIYFSLVEKSSQQTCQKSAALAMCILTLFVAIPCAVPCLLRGDSTIACLNCLCLQCMTPARLSKPLFRETS